MGGTSSGRYRTCNNGSLDATLRLDIRVLRRRGFLKPGTITAGLQRWTWMATGEESGSVWLTVNLNDPDAGFVTVSCKVDGEPRSQEIRLASRPMRYGGRRYYFVCPRQGRLCEVLASISGDFASRQALKLTYRSQSAALADRVRERAWALEERLWPEKGSGKPHLRGRNWQRLYEAWGTAEAANGRIFAEMVQRRFGRFL